MVLKTVLNQTINDEEVVETTNLFAVDYLKIKVQIEVDQEI